MWTVPARLHKERSLRGTWPSRARQALWQEVGQELSPLCSLFSHLPSAGVPEVG